MIIVTADSGESLAGCLQRVLAEPEVSEVWLVDNASSDGVPQREAAARQSDGRLQLLQQTRNLGFGAAVNRGAMRAGGTHLLILNPDCLLAAGSLGQLLASLQRDPRAGLVGAVVCDAEGRPDPASRRHDPLLRRALATLLRLHGDAGVAVAGAWPPERVVCDAVSGALMLLPRRAWLAVGGFDEGYFLHCEDLDLCRRLRDAGYRVWLDGAVRVEHGKGGSSRHRPVFVSWHKHRGMWRWFRRFDPAARRPWLAGLVWCGLWAHFLVGLPVRWLSR
ncbi:glycosyltransferase family 2 protein [Frateuria aurantia]